MTFLDGILQLHSLRSNHDTLSLPYLISSLSIRINEHNNYNTVTGDGKNLIIAKMSDDSTVTNCGGIAIENIQFRNISLRDEETAALNVLKFVPWFPTHSHVSIPLAIVF